MFVLLTFFVCFLLSSPGTWSQEYKGTPQPDIMPGLRLHALNLWIHLSSSANFTECVKIASDLPSYVDIISPNKTDEALLIEAGVGFGNDIWNLVTNSSLKFRHYYRRGPLGDMPDTGGDIFVHAKCNNYGKLYGLAKLFMSKFPKGSVKCFEDTYSFLYEDSRDLSLFIDGTMNSKPFTEERKEIAVIPSNGGSFCITQKWIHDFDRIDFYGTPTLESFFGRTRNDSVELENKTECSHVARIVGSTEFDAPSKFDIVRHAQPFGTVSGKAGLFFIAHAASADNFDFMLDRMVGKTLDGIADCIMKITRCVQSNYWYFPGVEELEKLKNSL